MDCSQCINTARFKCECQDVFCAEHGADHAAVFGHTIQRLDQIAAQTELSQEEMLLMMEEINSLENQIVSNSVCFINLINRLNNISLTQLEAIKRKPLSTNYRDVMKIIISKNLGTLKAIDTLKSAHFEESCPLFIEELLRPKNGSWINAIAISSGLEFLICGSSDGTLTVWDILLKKTESVLEGHTDEVYSICLAPDNKFAVSAGADTFIIMWDLHRRIKKTVFKGHADGVNSLAIMFYKDYLISGSDDLTVRVWNIGTRKQEAVLEGHTGWVNVVINIKDSIVSGSKDGTIRIWNVDNMSQEAVLEGHIGGVTTLNVMRDKYFVSGGMDGILKVWNLENRQQENEISGKNDAITAVILTNDGKFLVIGSGNKTVRVWDLMIRKIVEVLNHKLEAFKWLNIYPEAISVIVSVFN